MTVVPSQAIPSQATIAGEIFQYMKKAFSLYSGTLAEKMINELPISLGCRIATRHKCLFESGCDTTKLSHNKYVLSH